MLVVEVRGREAKQLCAEIGDLGLVKLDETLATEPTLRGQPKMDGLAGTRGKIGTLQNPKLEQ